MTERLTWWGVQFTINYLDFVMVYIIAHTLLKRYITFNWKHFSLAVLHTVIVAPLGYFDSYATQIASLLSLLFVIKFIGKRGISDSLIMYGLSWIMVAITQIPIAAVVWLFYSWLDFYRPFAFLIVQLLSILGVIITCKKFKLYQWFHALQVNSLLKLILFISALILLVVTFILNFEYSAIYLLFFTLVIVLIGLALFPLLITIYHNSVGMISVHDLKNSLLSMGIAMGDMENIEDVKNMIKEHSKEFGMDLSQLETMKMEDELTHMEAMNKKVKQFVQMKKDACKKDIEIISDLTYYEAHDVVDFQLTLKWLGTLLDNALEVAVGNPIYVRLFSMNDNFTLEVANEYFGEKGQDIKVIFERGYSTKSRGRGIGLHNLYTKVTELSGNVEVDEYYTEAHNCNYLQINIKFQE